MTPSSSADTPAVNGKAPEPRRSKKTSADDALMPGALSQSGTTDDTAVGVATSELRSQLIARITIISSDSEALVVGLPGVAGEENEPSPLTPGEKSKSAAKESIVQTLAEYLSGAGHYVSLVTRRDWELGFPLQKDTEVAPELVIVEASNDSRDRDFSATAELCRVIRRNCDRSCASILVVVPPPRRRIATANAIAHLPEAGADDVLLASAPEAEVGVRVNALVQMARLRRELDSTRSNLRQQQQLDDVTQLLTRRFFFQNAHREYERARRYNHELSCLMIGVNFYKRFNSTWGFECGDQLVRIVAKVLRDNTRDSDILGRFAEDKFVALLPETSIDGAMILRENMMKQIEDTILEWDGQELPLSISIGEAGRRVEAGTDEDGEIDEDGASLSLREEVAELLAEADAALYVEQRGVRFPSMPLLPDAQESSPYDNLGSLADLPSIAE